MLTDAYLKGFRFLFVSIDHAVYINEQGDYACIVFGHSNNGFGHISQVGAIFKELTAEQAKTISKAAYERQ